MTQFKAHAMAEPVENISNESKPTKIDPNEPQGKEKGEKVSGFDKSSLDNPVTSVDAKLSENDPGDGSEAPKTADDKPNESDGDSMDIPENMKVKMTGCCIKSYDCPWTPVKLPGIFQLLRWKFCATKHPVPNIQDLDRQLPVREFDVEKIKNPPVDGIQVTWIGHATMLVQFDDLMILTDPVLDTFCGPIRLFSYPRHRNAACQVSDMPRLDAVLISHNHYDHLETSAVRAINTKFPDVHWFVASGTKSWFLNTGCKAENVTELEWWEGAQFKGVQFVCTPSQHWCGRLLIDMNRCLWCSWVVKGPKHSFYFAGDTGYFGELFKLIGHKYGPFDLAGIPIGAYEPRFALSYQHVDPAEAVKIHTDVKSKMSIGIHWGAFQLTNEKFLEPPVKVKEAMDELRKSGQDCKEFISLNIGETWVVGEDRKESPFMTQKTDSNDAEQSELPHESDPLLKKTE